MVRGIPRASDRWSGTSDISGGSADGVGNADRLVRGGSHVGVRRHQRAGRPAYRKQLFTGYFRPGSGSIGTGTGLRATYSRNTALTDPVVTRIDRVPYFSWPTEPVAGAPKDDWGARWDGELQAQFSGTIRFWAEVNRDETLTVKVGSTTVIDSASTNGLVTGTVSMTQGQRYPIEVTFTDGYGSASLHLTYGPDDARRSALAGSQLYPAP